MPITTLTDDGSCSLLDPERQLHYRSHHGALTESTHVFLEGTGLLDQMAPWEVLELGFGGAFNCLNTIEHFLRLHENREEAAHLSYHTVERSPIEPGLLDEAAYDTWSTRTGVRQTIQDILHRARCGDDGVYHATWQEGRCHVSLHLYKGDWRDVVLPQLQVQAYYHDPFGPGDNPEGWTQECFAWAHRHIAPDGRMATYAAATRVRRAMVAAGFHVAKAPGSGRKREMTIASPTATPLAPYKIIPRERYLRPPENP